jgi:hypothetical protein
MPYIPVDQSSFINFFPEITDENNVKFLDIWNSFRVKVIPDVFTPDAYFEYTPNQKDTLYMIAYKYYGTSKLWWVTPLINDVEDPFDYIKNVADAGGTIKIMKSGYISNILFSVSRLRTAKDKS